MAWQCLGCLGVFFGEQPDHCPGGCRVGWRRSGTKRPQRGRIATLIKRDRLTCQLCGELVDRDAVPPADLAPTADHIVPRSRGGANTLKNLQLAHFVCNARKGDRDPRGLEARA